MSGVYSEKITDSWISPVDIDLKNDPVLNNVLEKIEYENAAEKGGLYIVPAKIGDSIYVIMPSTIDIEKYEIGGYEIREDKIFFIVALGGRIDTDNVGKTVFCTRLEAETKLKELMGEG